MASSRFFLRCALSCVLLVLLLGACHWSSDRVCDPAEMVSLEDPVPTDEIVDTLTPLLTWRYPDASCHPHHYTIAIFDHDMIRWPNDHAHNPPVPIHEGESYGPAYAVPASAGLQTGQTYFWRVMQYSTEGPEAGGFTSWFTTGPLCEAGESLEAPILAYPPDGAQAYFPEAIDLEWQNPMSCWPAGEYYVEISLTEDFSDMVWWGDAQNSEAFAIASDPPLFSDCTRYFWRVRADPAGGGVGPYSETWSFILSWSNVFCGLRRVITPVYVERDFPWVTVVEHAACWSGPGMEYLILNYLQPGQELEIEGRDQSSTWWYVDDPALRKACWVYGEHVQAEGDLSQVPVQEAPPVPTRTPTEPPPQQVSCGQYTSPTTCGNNQACWWDWNDPQYEKGVCKNR